MTEVVAYRTVAEPEPEGELDVYRMLLERRHRRGDLYQPVGGQEFSQQMLGAEPASGLSLHATVVACIRPVNHDASGAIQHSRPR